MASTTVASKTPLNFIVPPLLDGQVFLSGSPLSASPVDKCKNRTDRKPDETLRKSDERARGDGPALMSELRSRDFGSRADPQSGGRIPLWLSRDTPCR